jgi:hypothetical protein
MVCIIQLIVGLGIVSNCKIETKHQRYQNRTGKEETGRRYCDNRGSIYLLSAIGSTLSIARIPNSPPTASLIIKSIWQQNV